MKRHGTAQYGVNRAQLSMAAAQKAINPIVFLDFDGVLVIEPEYNSAAKVCVKHLNYIIKETDAHIVISSAWRISNAEEDLQNLLRIWGVDIDGRYLGQTPVLRASRGEEIRSWLATQQLVDHPFVILDDEDDMGAMIPWLVRTSYKRGLTAGRAARAVALLRLQMTRSQRTNRDTSFGTDGH